MHDITNAPILPLRTSDNDSLVAGHLIFRYSAKLVLKNFLGYWILLNQESTSGHNILVEVRSLIRNAAQFDSAMAHRYGLDMIRQILVVDDDAPLRETVIAALTADGYNALGAGNGQEALEQLARDIPSLILLDMNMPVMSGVQFLEKKCADPDLCHVPVIVMSDEVHRYADTFPAGTATIRKPFDTDKLLDTVHHHMML